MDAVSTQRACPFNPFSANNTAAYSLPGQLRSWPQREQAFAGQSCKAASIGLSWNCLGIGLPVGWRLGSQAESALHRLSFAPSDALQRAAQRAIIASDFHRVPRLHSVMTSIPSSANSEPAHKRARMTARALVRDGYAFIGRGWELEAMLRRSGLLARAVGLLDEAQRQREAAGGPSDVAILHEATVHGVGELLAAANNELLPVARHYLGEDAEFSGYLLFRLPPKLSPRTYASAHWHHDRCGHRLKAYIFLQNVSADSHPTQVAVGSQDTLFYSYHRFAETRFADRYVRANYRVENMVGGLGHGFIFDTNSAHRALAGSGVQRDAIMLEYNARNKSATLQALDPKIPCPGVARRLS